MTTIDKTRFDILADYDAWCRNRADVVDRENKGEYIDADVWADLGDAATDVMHRMAADLFPEYAQPDHGSENGAVAEEPVGEYYVQITETARYGLTVYAADPDTAERKALDDYCQLDAQGIANRFEAVLERESAAYLQSINKAGD